MKETWGVFDTIDEMWMADSTGQPILFSGELANKLAKAAGFIVDMRNNQRRGSTVERLYTVQEPMPTVKLASPEAEQSMRFLRNGRQWLHHDEAKV